MIEKSVRKLPIFLLIIGLLGINFIFINLNAFPDEEKPVINPATITIHISVFDCEHGNGTPNVKVTLREPLTGSIIKSATTDSKGKLMIWYETILEDGETPEEVALNTDIELQKLGSECLVRKTDEYTLTSSRYEATIEKEFCMKGCYKEWELFENITFPETASSNCYELQEMSKTRKCTDGEVGKRISPVCHISWTEGDKVWKRECALICSVGSSNYEHWVELRCSKAFSKPLPERGSK